MHVNVINAPLTGWRAKWLLRHNATGCSVALVFRSRSDSNEERIAGRWSSAPEPLSPTEDGMFQFDATKMPQSYRLDLTPGNDGEILGIAVKTDGDRAAYGFSAQSYMVRGLRHPAYELPHTEYDLLVRAHAGEIRAEATFFLENHGDRHTGLRLTPVS